MLQREATQDLEALSPTGSSTEGEGQSDNDDSGAAAPGSQAAEGSGAAELVLSVGGILAVVALAMAVM